MRESATGVHTGVGTRYTATTVATTARHTTAIIAATARHTTKHTNRS